MINSRSRIKYRTVTDWDFGCIRVSIFLLSIFLHTCVRMIFESIFVFSSPPEAYKITYICSNFHVTQSYHAINLGFVLSRSVWCTLQLCPFHIQLFIPRRTHGSLFFPLKWGWCKLGVLFQIWICTLHAKNQEEKNRTPILIDFAQKWTKIEWINSFPSLEVMNGRMQI